MIMCVAVALGWHGSPAAAPVPPPRAALTAASASASVPLAVPSASPDASVAELHPSWRVLESADLQQAPALFRTATGVIAVLRTPGRTSVTRFDASGSPVASYALASTGIDDFAAAFTDDGHLIVLTGGSRFADNAPLELEAYDSSGKSTWTSVLPSACRHSPTMAVHGNQLVVAWKDCGRVPASDDPAFVGVATLDASSGRLKGSRVMPSESESGGAVHVGKIVVGFLDATVVLAGEWVRTDDVMVATVNGTGPVRWRSIGHGFDPRLLAANGLRLAFHSGMVGTGTAKLTFGSLSWGARPPEGMTSLGWSAEREVELSERRTRNVSLAFDGTRTAVVAQAHAGMLSSGSDEAWIAVEDGRPARLHDDRTESKWPAIIALGPRKWLVLMGMCPRDKRCAIVAATLDA